jgi:hypothetical protein
MWKLELAQVCVKQNLKFGSQQQDGELSWITKKAEHLELIGLVVYNEERTDLLEERYHRQQEHVGWDKSLNHQQIRKLLGLGDTTSSAFANIDNWCLLT